jgi:hypothetical protein
MLPPGTLRYLKGNPDAILAAVVAAMAFGALSVGAPSAGVIAILAIVLGLYHIRRMANERHQREIAQLKVDEAAVRVEAIKAQHRALLASDQPSLPLVRPPARPTRR